MSGGKGGSQTTTVEQSIPPWAEEASQYNIDRARQIAEMGYIPYYGPTVAGFSPNQQAGIQGAQSAAQAFGIMQGPQQTQGSAERRQRSEQADRQQEVQQTGGVGYSGNFFTDPTQQGDGYLPQATDFGGIQGYSSGPLFDQAMQEFEQRRPGQAQAYNDLFIDPQTGRMPGETDPEPAPQADDYSQWQPIYGMGGHVSQWRKPDGTVVPASDHPHHNPGPGFFGVDAK